VRQDDNVIFACLPFFGQKAATQKEGLTHHLAEAGSHPSALEIFRLVFGGDVEVAARPGVDVLKDSALPLPVGEIPCGN
jgi:hypothetical protein